MIFTKNNFYYKYSKEKWVKEAIKFFNSLTEEQKELIEQYGQSRYSEGSDDGYDSGYSFAKW